MTQSFDHSITPLRNYLTTTSATHPVVRSFTRSAHIGGFTLIEMLVVLLIMGLFVGLVSTIVQPDDRALLRVEAERLAQLLDLAATKSRLSGRSIAWTADASGYRFWQFGENAEWSDIRDDDTLGARTFPQGVVITDMRIENMRAPEHVRLEFDPYGPTLAFSVEMSLGAARNTVAGSPIGDVRVLPDEVTKNEQAVRR